MIQIFHLDEQACHDFMVEPEAGFSQVLRKGKTLWCKNTGTGGDKAFYYPSQSNSRFSYKLVQCLCH